MELIGKELGHREALHSLGLGPATLTHLDLWYSKPDVKLKVAKKNLVKDSDRLLIRVETCGDFPCRFMGYECKKGTKLSILLDAVEEEMLVNPSDYWFLKDFGIYGLLKTEDKEKTLGELDVNDGTRLEMVRKNSF